MALIKCSECGREISDKAPACIHCGCPVSVSQPTAFGGNKVTYNGDNHIFDEFFGGKSAVQFTRQNCLKIQFEAVLSGAQDENSRQSVFVQDLGRNVEFTVPNTVKVGQAIRVPIQTERFGYILFVVASVARSEVKRSAAVNTSSDQEAITLLKNYKPNFLVRFFKSGFIGKVIGMTITFVAIGRFGDADPDAIALLVGIGLLLVWLGSLYPVANVKSYCKKHHIDEAIRKDSGNMNVAIQAFNALPTKKMLGYIRKLNPSAAQEIERQLAAKKKK